MTDFNYSPYFDDFSEAKGFHSVLFRPGFPVQSRELNQLQSILQNQVAKFGEHIFKHGSMVIPGAFKYDDQVKYLKLNTIFNGLIIDVNKFLFANDMVTPENRTIEGLSSGVRAIVLQATAADNSTSEVPTLIYKIISNGTSGTVQDFINNEDIKLVDSINLTTNESTGSTIAKTFISGIISGSSSIATVEAGVYFINGIFVSVNKQTIILDKYSNLPTFEVGLRYNETIVTENEDESLLDPALGASNYNGPGAHRYKIDLELIKLGPDDVVPNNFVLLFRVFNGTIQEIRDKTQYAELMKMIARRTYEESGNYITNPFEHKIFENANDPSQATMVISGGQAFVGGYEIDNTAGFNYVTIDKAKDEKTITGALDGVRHGQFLLAGNNYGIPTPLSLIELRDDSITNVGTPAGNIIGYAKVLATDYVVGNISNTQRILKVTTATAGATQITFNQTPGAGFTALSDFDLFNNINNDSNALTSIYITSVNVATGVATLSWPLPSTLSVDTPIYVGSGEPVIRIYVTDIDIDGGKSLNNVASYKMISTTTFNSNSVCGDILSGYVPISTEGVVVNGSSIFSMKYTNSRAITVLHDLNTNIILAKKAQGRSWPEGVGSFKISGDGPGAATLFTVQSAQRLITYNNDRSVLIQQLQKPSISDVSNISYTIYKEAELTFTGAGPYTATFDIADNEKFPSTLSADNFLIWNTTTGLVMNGLISLTTTRTSTKQVVITSSDASVSGDIIRVVAKVEKTLKEKTKSLLSTRVSRPAFSVMGLGQPDIYALNWVFDQTKDVPFTANIVAGSSVLSVVTPDTLIDNIKLGTYVFGSGVIQGTQIIAIDTVARTLTLNSVVSTSITSAILSARTNIANNYILNNGQTDSQYENGYIKLRPGAKSPTGILDIFFQHFEPGEGDFFSIKSYTSITQETGVDYIPYIPSYVSSQGHVFKLQDCLDFRPTTKDSSLTVYGSMGYSTTVTVTTSTSSPTVTLAAIGNIIAGDELWNGNVAGSTIIGTVLSTSGAVVTLDANAAQVVTSGTKIYSRSKTVTLLTGYSTRQFEIGASILYQGQTTTVVSKTNDTKFVLANMPARQYSSIVLNIGFQDVGGNFVSPYYNTSATPLLSPVVPGSDLSFNYSFFMPRRDVISLDTEGVFKVHKGYSAEEPNFPKILDSDKQMVVFKLEIPPYTFSANDIRVETVDRPGYTMAEIHSIDKRVDRLEEYTLLNMLEKSTTDYNITDAETGLDRYKSGFVVDNFNSLNVMDTDEFNTVKLDPTSSSMTVNSNKESHELFLISGESQQTYDTTYIENGIVTLKFVETPMIMNAYATSTMNLNPFAIFQWNGELKLTPDFNIDIASSTTTSLLIVNR